ncbi:MAG: glycoside hydrolase family 3 N-terminal domain-containing protein [Lysobacterales bacterium]
MLSYPAAWFGWFRSRDELAKAVAELLLIGFYGANSSSLSARLLARQVRKGQVGAVFFVNQNIGALEQVLALVRLFHHEDNRCLLAIDHEGGVVQRLTKTHGFTKIPAARKVASSMSEDEACVLYTQAGQELAQLGFNINLGPVLDFHEPSNPPVGKPGRAFDSHPETIAAFGQAFIKGFGSAGVFCAAKHFPGHGRAVSDSHDMTADITATWTEEEIDPYVQLIASPHPPAMVMTGHLRLDSIAPDGRPATIAAPIVSGLLRERLRYKGVIMTDDIDMGAVTQFLNRKDAFIQALAAGNDLIMIKNLFGYDPLLPQRAVRWVRNAIAKGTLNEKEIMASAERIRKVRQQAHQTSGSYN